MVVEASTLQVMITHVTRSFQLNKYYSVVPWCAPRAKLRTITTTSTCGGAIVVPTCDLVMLGKV